MPNWCENKLTVKSQLNLSTGNKEDLLKCKEQLKLFKEQAKSKEKGIETDIRMNNFIQMPKELINTVSPWEHPNWYEWALDNWGCKWDLNAKLIDETENSLIYEFDSPWGPPDNWLKNIVPMFPDLSFRLDYKEGGMCFQGTILAQNDLFIIHEEEYYEPYDEIILKNNHRQAIQDLENMRFL
jgi:hypothetical protein